LISQVFRKDFKPSKLNPDGKEIIGEKFWEERIKCIFEDCHFPNNTLERSHIGDLLSGTELNLQSLSKSF
jgi:hypothetical protein